MNIIADSQTMQKTLSQAQRTNKPQQIPLFYLFTLLRVILGIGLMHDALKAGSDFQTQRMVYESIVSSELRCADGGLPHIHQLVPGFPESPYIPTPLPSFPYRPSPTYEWFAVHLRWICSVLCFLSVAVSVVFKRLHGVLMESYGAEVAKTFQEKQTLTRCVESFATILSLLVYVSDNAYELYMQYFLSLPEGAMTDNNQWQLFLAEVIVVLLMGGFALCSTVAQFLLFPKPETIESNQSLL